MNRKYFGIHFRLSVTAFLLITGTTILLGYMGVNTIHKFVRSRFEERIQFLARYLALNAELGILIDERDMLDRLSRNLLAEKDIIKVSIIDADGAVLANVAKENAGSGSVIESLVVMKNAWKEDNLSYQWKNNELKGLEVIGKVRVSYTTEGIDRLLDYMKIRFIWLSAGLAGIAILIFFFISRSIVAPVNYLVNAANKVAKGSLEFRVKPGHLPETRELSIAFNAMLDSIQKSRAELDAVNREMIKQKTLAEVGKFSLMIAHEFKNPMSIIKSSVDILKKDLNPIPASGAKMIEFIEGEIVRLNRLVEDFLTFAKPTNPVFRRVDLNAMLNENLVRFDIQTSAYPIEIQSNIPEELYYAKIDPDLIGRVFDNILRNAFEANEHKNTIYISAFSENKRWVVEIEDEGCGILPENIDKIFEPFFTTRSTGTGLGLAFSSQVVKAHGGCLVAKNKSGSGRGAIFRVELQLCENENPSDEYKNG